jgi:hypothetical protein
MKRISRTVIAGCAFTAIAAAVCTGSARADSLQPGDALDSAKNGGVANAKDGGKIELSAKDGGKIELSAKDGGKIELSAKDGGKIEFALDLEAPAASKKDGGASSLAAF